MPLFSLLDKDFRLILVDRKALSRNRPSDELNRG